MSTMNTLVGLTSLLSVLLLPIVLLVLIILATWDTDRYERLLDSKQAGPMRPLPPRSWEDRD